jgi:hypothetical protein
MKNIKFGNRLKKKAGLLIKSLPKSSGVVVMIFTNTLKSNPWMDLVTYKVVFVKPGFLEKWNGMSSGLSKEATVTASFDISGVGGPC